MQFLNDCYQDEAFQSNRRLVAARGECDEQRAICELHCEQVGAEPDTAVCALVAELIEQRSMDGQLLPENVAVWRADALVVE